MAAKGSSIQEVFDLTMVPDKLCTISGLAFNDELEFTIENCKATGYIFQNCVFYKGIKCNGINLGGGIFFNDCTFKSSIHFIDVYSKTNDFSLGSNSITIKFLNCVIDDTCYFEKVNIDREILFRNSDINGIAINSLLIQQGGLHIKNCKVFYRFDIQKCRFSSEFRIDECEINVKTRLESNKFSGFSIRESKLKKNLHVWNCNLGGLSINSGKFNDDIYLKANKIYGTLTFHESECLKTCYIDITDKENRKKGNIYNIYIKRANFGNALEIKDSDLQFPAFIRTLNIEASQSLKGDIVFENLIVDKIKVTGINYSSNLIFDNIKVKNFEFNNFANYSNLKINNLKPIIGENTMLVLRNSLLNQSWFVNTNLFDFKEVVFLNSDISQIKLSNAAWFDVQKLNVDAEEKEIKYYIRLREFYRQLRFVMEQNGLMINARYFKQKEYKAFYNELKIDSHKRKSDFIIMLTNTTNSFGRNWWLPILYAIGFTFIFYYLIIFTIEPGLNFSFSIHRDDIAVTFKLIFCKYIHILPQLLNPTHSLKEILSDYPRPNFFSYLWDFLQKLFISFFIFQIIVAFRRYSK